MTVEIKCDFCDKTITIKKGKNHPIKIDEVDVKEYICDECKSKGLTQMWEDKKTERGVEWEKIKKEKKNFFTHLLENQEKKWIIENKKKHYGSFYKETL